MSVEKLTTSFMKKLNFSITFPIRKHIIRFIKPEEILYNVRAKKNYRNYEAEINVIDEETKSLKRNIGPEKEGPCHRHFLTETEAESP